MKRFWLMLALALPLSAQPPANGVSPQSKLLAAMGSSFPTDPAPGYTAWFDANAQTFSDLACTTPQTANAGVVNCWKSRAGSYGALSVTVPATYGTPTLRLSAVNGRPALRSVAATFDLLSYTGDMAIFETGVMTAAAGAAMCVVKVNTIDGTSRMVWGDNGGFISSNLVDAGGVVGQQAFMFDGANKNARKAASAAAFHSLTWLHTGGNLYSGVDDTRTASMATTAAGNLDAGAGYLVMLGGAGPGFYVDGDVAECVFYGAVTEDSRKITERYYAGKYALTLPY